MRFGLTISVKQNLFCFVYAVVSATAGVQVINPNLSNGALDNFTSAAISTRSSLFIVYVTQCGLNVIKDPMAADAVAGISCAILLALFSIQRFGTSRLGMAFSPVLLLWFLGNAAIGVYNIAW